MEQMNIFITICEVLIKTILCLEVARVLFRKLPELLKRGIFYTDEYKEYESFLKKETERLKCNINDMEIDDDDIYYDVEW